jgi:hypothetical protein
MIMNCYELKCYNVKMLELKSYKDNFHLVYTIYIDMVLILSVKEKYFRISDDLSK